MSDDSTVKSLFPNDENDDLRTRYSGLEEIYQDTAVITLDGTRFHRPSVHDEIAPSCAGRSDSTWRLVDTDDALAARFAPCQVCFGPVADHLARSDDSDVERINDHNNTAAAGLVADGGLDAINIGVDRLVSPTEEVLVTSGSSIYHAPLDDEPLCRSSGEYRMVDRSVLAGFKQPCSDCFDLDEE